MSDGQLAVNTNATNPGLFFKDADGSVRKIGPVFIDLPLQTQALQLAVLQVILSVNSGSIILVGRMY